MNQTVKTLAPGYAILRYQSFCSRSGHKEIKVWARFLVWMLYYVMWLKSLNTLKTFLQLSGTILGIYKNSTISLNLQSFFEYFFLQSAR